MRNIQRGISDNGAAFITTYSKQDGTYYSIEHSDNRKNIYGKFWGRDLTPLKLLKRLAKEYK